MNELIAIKKSVFGTHYADTVVENQDFTVVARFGENPQCGRHSILFRGK